MKTVFLSYVSEDIEIVVKLADRLKNNGIEVWLDRRNLYPGEKWKDEIRNAISRCDFFVCCFSENYWKKDISYMDEELNFAIKEFSKKQDNVIWLIPIKLSECNIPNRKIGPGLTLNDIHTIDLFSHFKPSVKKLLHILINDQGNSHNENPYFYFDPTSSGDNVHIPPAKLVMLNGPLKEEEYIITKPRIWLGRNHTCDIIIPDSKISGKHAVISYIEGKFLLKDNNSKNGTFIISGEADELMEQQLYHTPVELHHNNRFKLYTTVEFQFIRE